MTAQITVNFYGTAPETFFVTAPDLADAESLLRQMLLEQNRPFLSTQSSIATKGD
jgi:hypothetical protein